MKNILLLAVYLFGVKALPAQGIYQLWGLTQGGGSSGAGVIYSMDASGNNFRVRHQFTSGPNGNDPLCSLTPLNGKLYGTTRMGGSSDAGVIFEWDPSTNEYTKKIDFNISDGLDPRGFLTWNNDKFYGTTYGGGANQKGVIFEWDPATNGFTKKFDFDGINGTNPNGSLAESGHKLYGTTSLGGIYEDFYSGVIFEWDPVTNVFTKKIDLGADYKDGNVPLSGFTKYSEKFYGMMLGGGVYGTGVIFEWDPVTNTYSKKIDFENFGQPLSGPRGRLALYEGKFYGLTPAGESHGLGELFEWDPATNVYTIKVQFDSSTGYDASSTLTLSGGKFYGTLNHGGLNNKGVVFEWDPVTNVYLKKKDLDEADGQFSNELTLVAAPVSKGAVGSCVSFPAVTIDGSNNNKWVPVTDEEGNAVAEIKANGNNLGLVNISLYINSGPVREDADKHLYLDRNITLTPQVQPTSSVDIRLYIKGSEFQELKNAVNSSGDSTGIHSIGDVVIYKNEDGCVPAASVLEDTIHSVPEAWEADYVFTASSGSLSSFYFANRVQACAGPIIKCSNDTFVNAAAGRCGAVVKYKNPVVSDACGNAVLHQTAGLPSGAFFPVGTTINTFVVIGSSGKKDSCSFSVEVKDNKPPFITPVLPYPAILWPPNHTLRNVSINYFAWDNCEPLSCSLDVKSDEPVSGTGYDDKKPDWVVVDNHHIKLRAERSGSGDGRVYTVTVSCTDASGNISSKSARVFVPHYSHGHNSNGQYNFGEENEGYTDGDENHLDDFLDCKVLPNPSRGNFTLEIKPASDEKIEVSLFDVTGKLISKPGIVKNNTLRFGANLRPGVYMVEVRQGRLRKMIKVVKE